MGGHPLKKDLKVKFWSFNTCHNLKFQVQFIKTIHTVNFDNSGARELGGFKLLYLRRQQILNILCKNFVAFLFQILTFLCSFLCLTAPIKTDIYLTQHVFFWRGGGSRGSKVRGFCFLEN